MKMLKRTAQFDQKSSVGGPPAAQNVKLDVPKKTKLFLDQTVRERESGSGRVAVIILIGEFPEFKSFCTTKIILWSWAQKLGLQPTHIIFVQQMRCPH